VKDGKTVDLAFMERLVQLFERSSLAELDYSEAGSRIRLARGQQWPVPGPAAMASTPPMSGMLQASIQSIPDTRHVIQASFPGVFYRGAAPGQPPLVLIGDVVEDGQTLGLLEAMKLFNRVQADVAGRVAEIPVEDGATVEPGTALFILDIPEPPG